MSSLGAPDTTKAENWTPELLAALAVSRGTDFIHHQVRLEVYQLLIANHMSMEELLADFLYATGNIGFDDRDVVGTFYDQFNGEEKTSLIQDALILLWMRKHIEKLENPATQAIRGVFHNGYSSRLPFRIAA